jgi:hypothetical protein
MNDLRMETPEKEILAELKAALLMRKSGSRPKAKVPSLKTAVPAPKKFTPDAPAPRLEALVERDGVDPTAKALAAWEARIKGSPVVDIAHAMGLSLDGCRQLIREAHEAVRDDLKESLELNRTLDLQRIDGLLASFYPMAKEGHEESAYITLAALKHRAKLTGTEPGSLDRAFNNASPQSVLIWVQQALPQINKIVEALPLD